jgi:hypothetical protein
MSDQHDTDILFCFEIGLTQFLSSLIPVIDNVISNSFMSRVSLSPWPCPCSCSCCRDMNIYMDTGIAADMEGLGHGNYKDIQRFGNRSSRVPIFMFSLQCLKPCKVRRQYNPQRCRQKNFALRSYSNTFLKIAVSPALCEIYIWIWLY